VFEVLGVSAAVPAKDAVTVYAPRAETGNDADAAPLASVVTVCETEVDGPFSVNTTLAPDTAPAGAAVRVRIVLAVTAFPTRLVAGALNDASVVAAATTVAVADADSACTGYAPV